MSPQLNSRILHTTNRPRFGVTTTIPAGTEVQVRLVDSLSSARNRSGDTFMATLDAPILVGGWVAIPKGPNVMGRVIAAQPSETRLRFVLNQPLTITRAG